MNLYAMETLARQKQIDIEKNANTSWQRESEKGLLGKRIFSILFTKKQQQVPANVCCAA